MACGAVRILNRDNFYYFHDTAVSTDSILIGNIFGTLKTMYVQPTGTDTSYSISLYLDPPELGGVADANTILLTTISDCNAIAGNVYYVLPSLDPAANAYGGIPVCGEVYIKITDANSTTLTDIKVWLISD
jgi:hypothetical protein